VRTRVRLRVIEGGGSIDILQPAKWQRIAVRWKPRPSLRDVTLPQGNVAIGALVDVPQQHAQPDAWAIQNGNQNDNKRFLTIGGIRI
jgi:hypothetical protein